MTFTGFGDRDPANLEQRLKLVLTMLAAAESAVRQVIDDIDNPEEGGGHADTNP